MAANGVHFNQQLRASAEWQALKTMQRDELRLLRSITKKLDAHLEDKGSHKGDPIEQLAHFIRTVPGALLTLATMGGSVWGFLQIALFIIKHGGR